MSVVEDGMKEIFALFGIGMDEIGGKAMDPKNG